MVDILIILIVTVVLWLYTYICQNLSGCLLTDVELIVYQPYLIKHLKKDEGKIHPLSSIGNTGSQLECGCGNLTGFEFKPCL